MMCACISSYAELIGVMRSENHILTVNEADHFHKMALLHLQSYAWMHKHGMEMTSKHLAGKRCYLLLPKLHHLWHLAMDVKQSRVNPASTQLLTAESFIGMVGRAARACHRSTVSKRTLQKYLCMLHQDITQM